MDKAHPGYKAVGADMAAKQHIPIDQAYAELASAGRNASPKAKAANKRLKKIPGA